MLENRPSVASTAGQSFAGSLGRGSAVMLGEGLLLVT